MLFVNVPIGIVLLAGAWLALPRHEERCPRKSLDLTGAVTVTAGLAVLVYAIVSTDVHSWGSAQTMVTLAIGLVLLAVFFVTESRFASDPLVPLVASSSVVPSRWPTASRAIIRLIPA